MKRAYLAGDGLKKGNQILRNMERDAIKALGTVELFNPWDDKTINDKSKNPMAEAIHAKDFNALLSSEIVIADVDNNSVGTTTEMGEMNGVNYMLGRLHAELIDAVDDAEFGYRVRQLMREIPYKKVYWQTTDVRDGATESEFGIRRSHSYNQYLIGTMLMLAGEPKSFTEILKELSKIK